MGDDTWGSKLGDGTYDAVLFAWQFTSLAVTGTQTQIQTDGGNNFNGYSNKDADAAFHTPLTGEYDASKQQALLAQVDKDLWADAYGVTIFQFPEVNGLVQTRSRTFSGQPALAERVLELLRLDVDHQNQHEVATQTLTGLTGRRGLTAPGAPAREPRALALTLWKKP